MTKPYFLFANISYCFNGEMRGKSRYIVENKDACEKYNFEPMEVREKEVCWGFFQPGFTEGGVECGKQRKLNLEHIDVSFKSCLFADGITVIWCAQIDEIRGSSIIGWYKDAKVYKDIIKLSPEDYYGRVVKNFGYVHNVEALAENCVLLPKAEILTGKWKSPRKNTCGFGFGESNMWYAKEPAAQKYVMAVLEKINNYSGRNEILSDSVNNH